jgi:hypothetical protein
MRVPRQLTTSRASRPGSPRMPAQISLVRTRPPNGASTRSESVWSASRPVGLGHRTAAS